jgi:hypothetical protein
MHGLAAITDLHLRDNSRQLGDVRASNFAADRRGSSSK